MNSLTEQENDEAYAVLDALRIALHRMVDAATATLNEDQDHRVREILNDTFRFWRD